MGLIVSAIRSYRGTKPQLGHAVYIDMQSCVIGDVRLSEDVSIWPMAVVRGDVNYISIGARSNVQDGSVLHVNRISETNPSGYPLIIGEDVTIGHKAVLHGCVIQDRVLVGMGAVILDGAEVESEVIVAAGSVVPPKKRLLSGYVYVGNPVKQGRALTEEERAFFVHSAANYVLLKNEFLTEATS
jgi:carbonic anhydrase/acetyltransferase-like protein (isoleucine patch superfamily)